MYRSNEGVNKGLTSLMKLVLFIVKYIVSNSHRCVPNLTVSLFYHYNLGMTFM